MIYEYQDAPTAYPTLTYAGASELIGWGAISGMVAKSDGMINAVNDSFYGYQPTIFVIDPSSNEMVLEPLNSPKLTFVSKELVRDLISDLQQFGSFFVDKIEGLAITEDG
jgi:hypothetical protein